MWKNWSEEAVESDFKKLSCYGVEYLRVFPNWRDFQPVYPLYDSGVNLKDYRLYDCDIPKNKYYLDEDMLEKFSILCDLAEKYNLKLIVGILTGGMSGRAFLPLALYGKNVAKDPTSLMFSQLFVRGIVEKFKNKNAIYAWDLGNECNYFIGAPDRDAALNWTMVISNAIKAADPPRPLVSGMCGLDASGVWRIDDQAENTDILTTHPYPYWVRHCSEGEITSFQTLMHATCETKYYSDIGKKPCLVEEIGTMGPMVCDDKTAADFMRLNLYSNWVNGSPRVMWWCVNEQIDLDFPPYDFLMCEVELGMFDRNGNAKPVLEEVKRFSEYIKTVDFSLSKPEEDAVCLVTGGQDQWGVGYSSYVLAKQAGVNVHFYDACKEIPNADIYLMPSISGNYIMPGQNFKQLKKRVAEGATLYISNENGILSDFNLLVGVTVRNSRTKLENGNFELNGCKIEYSRERKYFITADNAEILANDENGEPIFTKHKYGKGTVYYLNFPLEKNTVGVCDAFDSNQHMVYNEIFGNVKKNFVAVCDNKYIGMTRHKTDEAEWLALINYSKSTQKINIKTDNNYSCKIIKGSADEIPPFEMSLLKFTEK